MCENVNTNTKYRVMEQLIALELLVGRLCMDETMFLCFAPSFSSTVTMNVPIKMVCARQGSQLEHPRLQGRGLRVGRRHG